MLARHGFRVLTASSGRYALELFSRERDEIDLVITDIVMPGIDGPALAGELQRLRPGLPVLFISGYPDRAGATAAPFLSKPFSSAALLGKVRSLILPDPAGAVT